MRRVFSSARTLGLAAKLRLARSLAPALLLLLLLQGAQLRLAASRELVDQREHVLATTRAARPARARRLASRCVVPIALRANVRVPRVRREGRVRGELGQ